MNNKERKEMGRMKEERNLFHILDPTSSSYSIIIIIISIRISFHLLLLTRR